MPDQTAHSFEVKTLRRGERERREGGRKERVVTSGKRSPAATYSAKGGHLRTKFCLRKLNLLLLIFLAFLKFALAWALLGK